MGRVHAPPQFPPGDAPFGRDDGGKAQIGMLLDQRFGRQSASIAPRVNAF
jgi:hypothetical protein